MEVKEHFLNVFICFFFHLILGSSISFQILFHLNFNFAVAPNVGQNKGSV